MIDVITVISTGMPRVGKRCRASVAAQRGVSRVEHVCVDAGVGKLRTKLENVVTACAGLPADRVVALVDGDDWLERDWALARVVQEHDAGALATYGSYLCEHGEPGCAAPYQPGEMPRVTHWRATHLKTFRAGLVQRIEPAHLRLASGEWIDRADDMAIMFPVLEMAASRAHFISDILYRYNRVDSFEHSATAAERAHQDRCVAYIRRLPHYLPIDDLEGRGAPFDERATGGPS